MTEQLNFLIFEDNDADALLMVKALEKAGLAFEWVQVKSKTAFEKAVKGQPDLILSDYSLPRYDVLKAMKFLDQKGADIPLIVVTGSPSEESAVLCIKQGAADYIQMERLDRLGETVTQALAEQDARRAKLLAERELQANEAKYRSLFEESGEGMFMIDPDGSILEMNDALADMFGYSREELIGKHIPGFFGEPEENNTRFYEILNQGIVRNIEIEMHKKDGGVFNCLLTSKVVSDVQGEVIGYHGIMRDITARERSQRELETIVKVNTTLRAAPNRAAMLPIIANLLQDIVRAEGVAIALRHPTSGDIVTEAASGIWKDWQDHDLVPEVEISEEVLSSGEIFHRDVIHRDPRIKQPSSFYDLDSAACFPLKSQNQSIGVVWVGCKDPFDEDRLNLIQLITNIAANALYRTTLHESNLRTLQESRAIAKIARNLNENLDLRKIFQLIVDATIDIIPNSNRAVVHLFDEENRRLHPVAMRYAAEEKRSEAEFPLIRLNPSGEFDFDHLVESHNKASTMSSGQGIAGIVIEKGETINVGDTASDERYLNTNAPSESRSLIVSPIMNAERRLGTISVLSNEPYTFTDADEDLLDNLCLQATTAIENARLLEALRIQRVLAEAAAQISTLINKSLEFEEVLEQILENVLKIFGFKAANIRLIAGDQVEVAGHLGYQDADEFMERYHLGAGDLSETKLVDSVYQSGVTVVNQDVKNEAHGQTEQANDWLRSYVSIPLKVGEEVVGFLNADSDKVGFVTEDIIHRLKIFANNAATAVNNARLFSELETSLKTEQATRLQLIRSDKLAGMGRLVASVAHELNNPLQTIKNCLFLLDGGFSSEDDMEMFALAVSEVERLSGIVARLREVYRPRSEEQFGPTAISPLLADVIMLLETHLRRNNVTLELKHRNSEFAMAEGFPDKLKQVFLNLSHNAIEAMQPEGGTLTIRTMLSKDGKEVGIAFSDTGAGVSKEMMTVLFDPFYTTKESGMGLGLTISYDIAQNHNGRITIANNPDRGATFTVWLPLSGMQEEVLS